MAELEVWESKYGHKTYKKIIGGGVGTTNRSGTVCFLSISFPQRTVLKKLTYFLGVARFKPGTGG